MAMAWAGEEFPGAEAVVAPLEADEAGIGVHRLGARPQSVHTDTGLMRPGHMHQGHGTLTDTSKAPRTKGLSWKTSLQEQIKFIQDRIEELSQSGGPEGEARGEED
jgi:hypothetical protein